MIRKMLIIAAAVAMPASVLAGVTSTGVASAAKPAPTPGTCATSGTVVFATPGLSSTGAITSKTTESTATTQAAASGSICGTAPIKVKIASATSACWSTLPVYNKTAPVGGVLASGAASSCDVGGASASSDPTVIAADVKLALKSPRYYDTLGGLATSLPTIVSAINAKPLKISNNGNKGVLTATSAAFATLAQCPVGVGFAISGTTTFAGAGHVLIVTCLVGDSGTGTTGSFSADLSSPTAVIASATIAGASAMTYSA